MIKRVLLVDDDEPFAYLMKRIINSEDHAVEVEHCLNGKLALDYISARLATADPETIPDVIFLDINMPVMSGFEFLEKLSSLVVSYSLHLPPPKICVLSSSRLDTDKSRATGYSIVNRYLVKPLGRAEIGKILREVS